jgi:putative protease
MHISLNSKFQTVQAYHALGAKRVNLAQELSLNMILDIQKHVAGHIETEVFIHGAVCFSYSGRCAISDYLTEYQANHGQCKHPCRWQYTLVEETRPGQYMPVFEDERGLYFFNSSDLTLFEFVPALRDAGVTSFKNEGRMKSIHYIASPLSFYRQVMDGRTYTWDQGMALLNRVPNRGYSMGFMKGSITPEDYSVGQSLSQAEAVFVGNVTGSSDGRTLVQVRNKIRAGDVLEVLQPNGTLSQITMPTPLITADHEEVNVANHTQYLPIKESPPEYIILRRLKEME